MNVLIGDSERRTAAGLALRLPTWTDGAVCDALHTVALTPFIQEARAVFNFWRGTGR